MFSEEAARTAGNGVDASATAAAAMLTARFRVVVILLSPYLLFPLVGCDPETMNESFFH